MSGLAGLWWAALLIQLAAIPGTLLPVLPGLALLPLGAGLWLWASLGELVAVLRLAQALLALIGVFGFVLLSRLS